MIHTRFDLITAENMDGNEIFACKLHQVPSLGETVNIKGNPYVVTNIGYSLQEKSKHNRWDEVKQYAYVKVVKHH